MTVEEHVHVCLDETGHPIRAYHHDELDRAREAVDSDSYSDWYVVEVRLDVPLMERDGDE